MTSAMEASINLLTTRLVEAFNPEKIILFGSYAWGTPTKDSDIDICVIVKDTNEREIDRMIKAREVTQGIWVAKDILVKTESYMTTYSPVKSSLAHKILSLGKLLYERKV